MSMRVGDKKNKPQNNNDMGGMFPPHINASAQTTS